MNTAPWHDLFHSFQETDSDLVSTFWEFGGMGTITRRPILNTIYLRVVARKTKLKGKAHRLNV